MSDHVEEVDRNTEIDEEVNVKKCAVDDDEGLFSCTGANKSRKKEKQERQDELVQM